MFLRYFSQMMFLPLNWTSTFIVQTWHDVLVFSNAFLTSFYGTHYSRAKSWNSYNVTQFRILPLAYFVVSFRKKRRDCIIVVLYRPRIGAKRRENHRELRDAMRPAAPFISLGNKDRERNIFYTFIGKKGNSSESNDLAYKTASSFSQCTGCSKKLKVKIPKLS